MIYSFVKESNFKNWSLLRNYINTTALVTYFSQQFGKTLLGNLTKKAMPLLSQCHDNDNDHPIAIDDGKFEFQPVFVLDKDLENGNLKINSENLRNKL